MPRNLVWMAVAATMLAGMLAPEPAHAWWHRHGWGGGVFIGPPIVVGPPVYYGPPPGYYYAPAPRTYAQAGEACYAGAYVCPLDQPTPAGAPCSCPTNTQARSYGVSR